MQPERHVLSSPPTGLWPCQSAARERLSLTVLPPATGRYGCSRYLAVPAEARAPKVLEQALPVVQSDRFQSVMNANSVVVSILPRSTQSNPLLSSRNVGTGWLWKPSRLFSLAADQRPSTCPLGRASIDSTLYHGIPRRTSNPHIRRKKVSFGGFGPATIRGILAESGASGAG